MCRAGRTIRRHVGAQSVHRGHPSTALVSSLSLVSCTMAPKHGSKRRLTDEELYDALQARALAVKSRSIRQKIQHVLNRRPDLLPSVLQHLKDVGGGEVMSLIDKFKDKTKADADDTSRRTPKTCKTGVKDNSSHSDDPDDDDASDTERAAIVKQPAVKTEATTTYRPKPADLRDPFPRCYRTWQDVPVQYLEYFLSVVELVSMSPHALRGLREGKQKSVPKAIMLKLWELVFAAEKEEDILLAWRSHAALIEALKSMNHRRGRLARELMMPPDYVEQGAYILDLDSKPPCVKHRPSGLIRDLPTFIHSCSSVQVCYIDKNWSDRNVVVVDPRGHSQFQLALLFGEAASLMRLSPEAPPVFAQPVGSEVPQDVGEVGAASSTKQEQLDDSAACAGPKIEPGLNAEKATRVPPAPEVK